MYIHISKKEINISLHINLNVLKKFMILCWAKLIAVLGRMRHAGHGLDSSDLNDSLYENSEPSFYELPFLSYRMVQLFFISL